MMCGGVCVAGFFASARACWREVGRRGAGEVALRLEPRLLLLIALVLGASA